MGVQQVTLNTTCVGMSDRLLGNILFNEICMTINIMLTSLIILAPYLLHDTTKNKQKKQGAVSIRKTVLPGMAIPMLKIRRPNGRLIFNMEITIRR